MLSFQSVFLSLSIQRQITDYQYLLRSVGNSMSDPKLPAELTIFTFGSLFLNYDNL